VSRTQEAEELVKMPNHTHLWTPGGGFLAELVGKYRPNPQGGGANDIFLHPVTNEEGFSGLRFNRSQGRLIDPGVRFLDPFGH
jgi:hypothetical protein